MSAEAPSYPTRGNQSLGPTVAALALTGTLFVGTVVGWFSLPRSPAAQSEVMVLIWINIAFMLGALTVEVRRRPYSLHMMHLICLFLFLGAAAIFQYSSGTFGVAGPIQGVRKQVVPATLAATVWLLGYVGAYEGTRLFADRGPGPAIRFLKRPVSTYRATLTAILALVSLVYLGSLGLFGALTRGAAQDSLLEFTRQSGAGGYAIAFYLIHHMLLRAFSLVALLAAILVLLRNRSAKNPLFLMLTLGLGVGTLVLNNPFAAARMWLATALIGFAAPFALKRLRTGWALALIAFSGLALLPALHLTRFAQTFSEWLEWAALVSPVAYLAGSSDVDSLGMLTLCQQWSDRFGLRWGMQALGSVSWWFPRALWPSKPIETGAMVTGELGFEFTNLSPPIMSDPLVDFGFPGILFFGALYGILFSRLDRAYWEVRSGEAYVRVIDCIYPLWLGCVVFLTRGGSFGSIGFTAVFTAWVIPLAWGVRSPVGAANPPPGLPGAGFPPGSLPARTPLPGDPGQSPG